MVEIRLDMPSSPNRVQRPWVVPKKPFERENSNQEFYNSRAWRNCRKLFLELNPLCKHCDVVGLTEPAKVVDHIVPINKGGDRFNYDNLQALCVSCHNKKSARDK